jgi:hypothetical protein
MRRSADTAKLPSAMQSTKHATIIENVNCEAPSASAPTRFRMVWSDIIAKPESKATLAHTLAWWRSSGAATGMGSEVAGESDSGRRAPPRRAKTAPAPRFTSAIASITPPRPSHGIRKKLAHSAPANAPAVLNPYTKACKRVESSRLRGSDWVSSGMVPPMSTVGGPRSRVQRAASIPKASPGAPDGIQSESFWMPRKSSGKHNAYVPIPASITPYRSRSLAGFPPERSRWMRPRATRPKSA